MAITGNHKRLAASNGGFFVSSTCILYFLGSNMRDYTYLDGGRFFISNIYRSKRFDIDRLDLNWVDVEKPDFVRGFRVVDHQSGEVVTVNGEDADNLIFSMSYIGTTVKDSSCADYDAYIIGCLDKKNYLTTTKKDAEECVLH